MARLKIGQILLRKSLITEKQLNEAIEIQKRENGRLGDILIAQGHLSEHNLLATLANQLGLLYCSSERDPVMIPSPGQSLDKLVPLDFAKQNLVLPLSKDNNTLTCVLNDPLDLILVDNLAQLTGCEISVVLATKTTLQKAINKFYSDEPMMPIEKKPLPESSIDQPQTNDSEGSSSMMTQKYEQPLPQEDDPWGLNPTQQIQGEDGKDIKSLLGKAVETSYVSTEESASINLARRREQGAAELSIDNLIAKAGEAPVIKLVDLIIRQAIDEKASDIHIEPFESKTILRYRIDGTLFTIPPPAPHLHLPIISRIKILAKLDIAEKRLPQDGNITAKLEDRVVDIRISTVPTVWGEKVVMRILDKAAIRLELNGLGFSLQQIELIRKALTSPYGLIFVTGPTGSGKSTTLYSALNECIDSTKNIMTAENPVEYKLEGINQVNIRSSIGLTFTTALKAFLRQDPDVIMVGEVRDLDTASICVRAALTGHLVLSTLHTNDAASAISRLLDLGIPGYLLTPSLILIIAQRLAKRLCQDCKEPYEPIPEQHGGIKFKSDLIYKSKGCEICNFHGYKGRLVIAEVLPIDNKVRELISKNASSTEITDAARKNGMLNLFESGIKLVEQGMTSFDEICRISVDI